MIKEDHEFISDKLKYFIFIPSKDSDIFDEKPKCIYSKITSKENIAEAKVYLHDVIIL